ncbi:MAG: hypothetical protein U1C60_03690, partial [Rhodocyclaceae bacterium]|nr:hypothetical protein [Rhodocyclaceae bacterium]
DVVIPLLMVLTQQFLSAGMERSGGKACDISPGLTVDGLALGSRECDGMGLDRRGRGLPQALQLLLTRYEVAPGLPTAWRAFDHRQLLGHVERQVIFDA